MNPSEAAYAQPEKHAVRQRVIAHAVNSLTKERESSPVVTAQQFDRTMDYSLRFLEKNCNSNLRQALKHPVEDWRFIHKSRVGARTAEDLSVLFLAGPDPTPDLMNFRRAGVPFTNIWAVERDPDTFKKAIGILGREGTPLKVYNGDLHQFFSIVPQQFDIVYFDACGQLFGGKPNTIHVLRELFLHQRLAPLSVLITNFCEPYPKLDPALLDRTLARSLIRHSPKALAKIATAPDNQELGVVGGKLSDQSPEEKELHKWARLVGLWSYANGDDNTWTQHFDQFVDTVVLPDLLGHYSRFTTEFTIQFAGQLLPWWRVVALPGSRREYFSNEEALSHAVAESAKVVEAWPNPLYSALRHLFFTELFLDKSTAPHEFYFKETLAGRAKLGDAVRIVSLIRTFLESEWGDTFFPTKHIQEACSPNLVKVLQTFKWFDHGKRIFCYDPLPHLIADLLVGLYGYVVMALEKAGYDVTQMCSVAEAVAFLREYSQTVDGVILDVMLPAGFRDSDNGGAEKLGGGHAVFTYLQSAHPGIPILILSNVLSGRLLGKFQTSDHVRVERKLDHTPSEIAAILKSLVGSARSNDDDEQGPPPA